MQKSRSTAFRICDTRGFWWFLAPRKNEVTCCSDNFDASGLPNTSFEKLCPILFKEDVDTGETFKILGPTLLWSQAIRIVRQTNPFDLLHHKSIWNAHWAAEAVCMCRANKSCSWWKNKQPIAFSVLIWFWSTNRNWFSPTNGRENGSSVYRQTRLGQLYKVTQIGYISEIYSVEIFTFESSLARAVNSSCIWSPLRQEKLRLRLLRQARPLWTKIIFRSLWPAQNYHVQVCKPKSYAEMALYSWQEGGKKITWLTLLPS